MNTKKIRDHLSLLIKDRKMEKLELMLRQHNFFYILGCQHVEIRHSNFLAWLLNPRRNHGLGDLFLKRFLKDIFSNQTYDWINEFSVDALDLANVEIRREWNRIDLLILTEWFAICIENKIWAGEHSDQLHRYQEIMKKTFPKHKIGFIYLTPHGNQPMGDDDANSFQTYSYADVSRNLYDLLTLYSDSIPNRVRCYIEDYHMILRREIMKEDDVNELARQIYSDHAEALDFIFENKPDRLYDIANVFEYMIKDEGWKLASKNKGYTRFLTKALDSIIPRSGTMGWKNKEIFLFEFDYWPKKITFKATISPGNDEHRKILADALRDIAGATNPKGKQWLTYFSVKTSFDVTEHTNDETIKKLRKIWPEVTEIVNKVESKILEIEDQFR